MLKGIFKVFFTKEKFEGDSRDSDDLKNKDKKSKKH